jgi:hypothetical protein
MKIWVKVVVEGDKVSQRHSIGTVDFACCDKDFNTSPLGDNIVKSPSVTRLSYGKKRTSKEDSLTQIH